MTDPDSDICSRAGCRQLAQWEVVWRNPRIHAEDREKIWLACSDHQEFLYSYLSSRSFPVAVRPLQTRGIDTA